METEKEEAKKLISQALEWMPSEINKCLAALVSGGDLSVHLAEINRLKAKQDAYDTEIDGAVDKAAIDVILGSVTRT